MDLANIPQIKKIVEEAVAKKETDREKQENKEQKNQIKKKPAAKGTPIQDEESGWIDWEGKVDRQINTAELSGCFFLILIL